MRSCAFIIVVAPLLAMCAGPSQANEKQDAAQLDQLISKIEPLLPDGWSVAFEVSNDDWRRERPMLVIRSKEKLPVEYESAIGRPAAGPDPNPYIVQEIVKLELAFVPYMTPQEYTAARGKNDELEQQRLQYRAARLDKMQIAHKGDLTPLAVERHTGNKSPLAREYAFLWLRTMPQPLPTHHYGTLAAVNWDLPPMGGSGTTIKIHNAEKDKQYHAIISGLEKILVPYEKTSE